MRDNSLELHIQYLKIFEGEPVASLVLTSCGLIISKNWCFAVTVAGGPVVCGNAAIISLQYWEYQEQRDALSLITTPSSTWPGNSMECSHGSWLVQVERERGLC